MKFMRQELFHARGKIELASLAYSLQEEWIPEGIISRHFLVGNDIDIKPFWLHDVRLARFASACQSDPEAPGTGPKLTQRIAGELERVKGIEPSFSAWEADVLPLNDTRKSGS